MAGFRLIYCVVNMGDGSKTLKSAKRHGAKGGTISIGRGTVNSRLLEVLGLNDIRKEFVSIVVSEELAADAIKGISKDMAFEKPHNGIAFSHSIYELFGSGNIPVSKAENIEVKESMYYAIYVIVDKGKAEDVIEAANKAGARGGTILNARAAGIDEVQKLFSIEIEPEREEAFIIAKSDMKDAIIDAIRRDMKIDEPGNGIILVLEVNEAYGLH